MNSAGLNWMGPPIRGIFSINVCTVFNLLLGVHGCRGPTVYIDLHSFIKGTWAPWIWHLWGTGSYTQSHSDTVGTTAVKFLGSLKLSRDFSTVWSGSMPNPCIVEESTVYLSSSLIFLINILYYNFKYLHGTQSCEYTLKYLIHHGSIYTISHFCLLKTILVLWSFYVKLWKLLFFKF